MSQAQLDGSKGTQETANVESEQGTQETQAQGQESAKSDFDVKAFADKVEARMSDMGKQLGKFHERFRSLASDGDEGAKPKSNGKGGLTEDDLAAAVTLGEKRAKLPQAARAKLDAMREAGKSFREVADMADILIDALADSKGSEDGKSSKPSTRDNPASGPRQTNGASVRTYKEYQELAHRARFKDDANAKRIIDALNADPEFSISSLPLK